MANKELYNVLVDITLKPYGHTEEHFDPDTKEPVEVFVEDVANLSTSEEDVAVALGKLHAWYSNFKPCVFDAPVVVYEDLGETPRPTTVFGFHGTISFNYGSDSSWFISRAEIPTTDHRHIYVASEDLTDGDWWHDRYSYDVDARPDYIKHAFTTFFAKAQSEWVSGVSTIEHVGVHLGCGNFTSSHAEYTDYGVSACELTGYPHMQADLVFFRDNDAPFVRTQNQPYSAADPHTAYWENWHALLLPENIVSGDNSITVSTTDYSMNIPIFGSRDGKLYQDVYTDAIPYRLTLSHANTVTAQATSGMYKFTYDANGHITGSTAVQKSDITALGIPGSNTDTKVTQNVTTGSSIYPLLLSYYTTSSSTTTAQTANRSNNLAFNPSGGELFLYRKGSYITTTDSSDTLFGLICYNGSNLWIGSNQSSTHHHTGATYISTGYNTSTNTGNPTFYAAVPNATNTGSTNYDVLHQGNTYFQTSSNASTWEAIGITKAGYALHIYRGNGTSSTPPYCAGAYASGLVYGGGDTKGFISNAYNSAKVTFGGGERKSSDTSAKAPTWYFSLTGTTATTYNLDDFALAADYLPLAGGTMDSGATVTVYADQAETQGIQYTSTGQRFKIASGVGWARSVTAYKGAFSGDILGSYGIFGASDSFTNNRMNYFYIGKAYNDQWYEFAYGKHSIVDNDLNGWMLRYRYPWTSGSSTGTYEGSFISLYPYDRYGYCLCVGENSGGLTIVGGGEAAQQLRTTVTNASTSPYGAALSYGTESLMMGADSDLYFVSGASSLTTSDHTEGTNLKTFIWSNAGTLRPWNDNTYSIGAATKRWNYGYFTNISGKLIGTIDSSTTATTQTLPNVTSRVATCQFAWNLYNNSGIFYNDSTDATTAQNNPWQCIAEATVTASGNTYISTTFLIDSAFSSYPGTGIVHFRASIKLSAAESYCVYALKWLTSDTNVNDSTIVFTYKVVSNTSCAVKVWAKAPKRYEAIHIHPLYEATRAAARTSEFWTYNVNNSGVASIPSDEHVMTSTTKQVLLHESASSPDTSLECTVTNLFKIWQVVYVCIQNLSYGSGANPMSINFMVPLGYVKAKSNYNTAIGTSSNPGYYVGEGYNPSNTGSSHTRLLVQWKNDNTIVFTNGSGNRMGIVRIYGIS